MSFQDLLAGLRRVDGLREVGNHPDHPHFHFRSREFLHFHVQEGRVHADVRFGKDFVRGIPATTDAEQAELLNRIQRHVGRIRHARKLHLLRKRGIHPYDADAYVAISLTGISGWGVRVTSSPQARTRMTYLWLGTDMVTVD